MGDRHVKMPRRHSFATRLAAAVLAGAAIATGPLARSAEAAAQGALDPLELPQVSRLAARDPVDDRARRVRGVVTAVAAEMVALQHGTDACWVRFANATVEPAAAKPIPLLLAPGTLVEAEGTVQPGGFAPVLEATRITVLGSAPLPAPLPPDTARLFSGVDNGLRVAVEGILQGVRGERGAWRLIVAADSRRIPIDLDGTAFPERPQGIVDTRVRVVGVARAVANTRGEFVAPAVLVSRVDDLVIVAPQPAFGWQVPSVPLGHLARFERREGPWHRVQTEGVVTHAAGRLLVLQDGLDGLEVETARRSVAVPGERVRVSGFVDTSRGCCRMVEAMVSRLEPEGVPPAEPITPTEVLAINRNAVRNGRPARPGTFAGCLVRFPARLVAIERVPEGLRLTLDDVGTLVEATLAGEAGAVATLVAGSRLDVTGILGLVQEHVLTNGGSRPPSIRHATILVRSPADVVLVAPPAWWTPGRMAAAVTALAAVLAGSLVWVGLLRRQVVRQSRRLAAEMSSRTAAALEYQVTLRERTHLATNLHDTVLQVLAGIGYQLKACRIDAERRGETASPRLASAEGMVADCVGQLRGTLWTLRTLPTGGRTFAGSLADLVARMAEGRSTVIELDTKGDLDRVDETVAGQLLLVAQEAVANAVNHARPDRVEVSVNVDAAGGIDLVVRDDGGGFDPADRAGPAQGHFGLDGIHDRVARVGGTVAIASRPGAGTQVTVRVPAGATPTEPVVREVMEAADA